MDPETRRRLDSEREAREQGVALLLKPGNEWAGEVFERYLDRKDWAMGLRPGDVPPGLEAAFRAIRQGSDGQLGNPPLL